MAEIKVIQVEDETKVETKKPISVWSGRGRFARASTIMEKSAPSHHELCNS